ncbi:MAG: Rv3235 family protein [Intrasporangium sp.]|uniref:Rv3235 family protein n=1 Tax=Intrasporangium sp. TaxID=1925024 RepID=UPI002648D47C|nr:Rv3235 family protein [Intrasporangium sp.]MDN5795574.1 Rv3235 family protein [Intrasporangium sp.]
MTTRPVLVRPVPATEPPVISAEEAYRPVVAQPYTQAALALDFTYSPGDDSARRLTRRSKLPDPLPFVAKIAQAIVEVITAQRPAPQLIRHTSPAIYSGLARRALVAAKRRPGGARRPAMVRRVRICEPADGIVEACAVVVVHGRVRALALRLEGLDGRWLVTQLTVG